MKSCKMCGKEMSIKVNNQKYCGDPCTYEMYVRRHTSLKSRDCAICNSKFQPVTNINAYCSKECQKVGSKKFYQKFLKKKREDRAVRLKERPEKTCAYRHCNRKFKDVHPNKRFCSTICQRGNERVVENEKWLNREKVNCQCCSRLFIQKNSNQIYCSKICKQKFRNERDRERYRENPNRPCSRCKHRVLSKNSKSKICDRCSKDLHQIKMNRQKFNTPESDIIFEPDSQDFFNSPWTRLQQRHYIDLEPTDSSVESSDFKDQIQNYLKKGGKITKLSVGFASSPINMELT